jgi:hypothetical protein
VRNPSASSQAGTSNSQENLRTIKLYFQVSLSLLSCFCSNFNLFLFKGANPFILVVNLAFLTIFELEEAACKLYGVEVLRLCYSSSSYKQLLSSSRSSSSKHDAAAKVRLIEMQQRNEASKEKPSDAPRKVLLKKGGDPGGASLIGVPLHQLNLPEGCRPFRSVAEIPIEDLTDIGTTVQLADLLKPLNNHTFVIHALESEDRGICLTLLSVVSSIQLFFVSRSYFNEFCQLN